jgi:antitoxin YefM
MRTRFLYNRVMAIETTYTRLRDNLKTVLDQVVEDQEVIIVRRRGSPDVALVAAEELAGLMETAHLLQSPANAKRLLAAHRRAERRKGKISTLEQLRRETGLGAAK